MSTYIPFLPTDVRVPTPLKTYNRPIFQNLTLATEFPTWNPLQGGTVIAFVNYVSGTISASTRTIFQLTDGTSTEAIGIRIVSGTTSTAVNFRRNNVATWTSALNQYDVEDTWNITEPHAVGLSWDTTKGLFFGRGQYEENLALTGLLPLNVTQLGIGMRNGGSDPLPSTALINKLIVFKETLTKEQIAAVIQRESPVITVLTAGQSNAAYRIKNLADANGENGFRELKNNLSANLQRDTFIINGATGGSAIFKTSDPSNFWLDEDTGAYGTALQTCLAAMNRFGGKIDFIIWDQGEADVGTIGTGGKTIAQYKTQLLNVYSILRSKAPNAKILICPLGKRITSGSNSIGYQAIRELQVSLCSEFPNFLILGSVRFDLPNIDPPHLSNAGYTTLMQRDGFAIRGALGLDTPQYPVITGAVRSSTTVTVTLRHSKGTDFTPTTAIEGFRYVDNSNNVINITAAVRTNATTITLTLASGVAGTLYYAYGDMLSINQANLVKDNSATTMPLRSYVQVVT
jgi:hypothetical protein